MALPQHQRGEIWLAVAPVGSDPSPSVGRSVRRIVGCASAPLMEIRGGVSALSCDAFNGCALLATNRFQSSVCLPQVDVPGTGNQSAAGLHVEHLAPNMAGSEAAIGIELIEQSDTVAAPAVSVQG